MVEEQLLLPSSEQGAEEGVEGEPPLWKRMLFGFWPCTFALLLCASVCIVFNVHLAATDSLGFDRLTGLEAVEGRLTTSMWLLLFRSTAAVVAAGVVIQGVLKSGRSSHGAATFHGLEVCCAMTMWCWIGQVLYFLPAALVTAWYVCTGSPMSPTYAAVLWVWFEVMYAMAWMVTLATWLVIVPAGFMIGQVGLADYVCSFARKFDYVFQHVANLFLMQIELLLSVWSVRPEHSIFCIYFGMIYIIFNWWLHSKTQTWIYPFLNYDTAGVPSLLALVGFIYAFFWLGVFSASFVQ